MTSSRRRSYLATGILLATACQGGEQARAGRADAGPASAETAGDPASAGPSASAPGAAGAGLRDPVRLTAAVEVDGDPHKFSGLGECQHTTEASIYQVPAAMWSTRFSTESGEFRHLSLTLWQPKAGGGTQVSLAVGVGEDSYRIATVEGGETHGRGSARIERDGAAGTLYVDGEDATGRRIRLTVECPRFAEPVAEGG